MNSMKVKFAVVIVIVGLLSACAAPATEAPTLTATEQPATATEAPTNTPAATDTSAPTTEPTTASVPTTDPAAASATVSFAADVLPILQSRCLNCHGGNRTEEGLSLRTHADVLTGSDNGAVVVPGDATNSLLFEMVSTQEMPKRGPKLTPDQVQLIMTWINEGALDN